MAVTNKVIMQMYRTENNIPDSTELYTAAVWFNMGYKIKKGERCKHRVTLWTRGKPTFDDEGNEVQGHCFGKVASLFERTQVEKRTKAVLR